MARASRKAASKAAKASPRRRGGPTRVASMRFAVAQRRFAAFDDTGRKRVDFACSCAECIVGITAADVDFAFVGSGGDSFPVGSYPLFYRVQGEGPYTITVSGATVSAPIAGNAPDAGVRVITV